MCLGGLKVRFLTTGYRILRWRCCPVSQPGDFPRGFRELAGEPITLRVRSHYNGGNPRNALLTAKTPPIDWATLPSVKCSIDFCS